MEWNKDKDKYLRSLVTNYGTKWTKISKEMTKQFNEVFSYDQVRARWRMYAKHEEPEIDPVAQFGVKKSRDRNTGIEEVERLVAISNMEDVDDEEILILHGYDPNKWEIVNHQFSMWNHHNKVDGTKTLYASKIKVQPNSNGIDFAKLLETVKNVPPYTIEPPTIDNETYLNIPLADMHFTIATYEDYKQTQSDIIHLIQKGHKEILFILGNDLFHHNDHRNRTASGREIEQGDIIQAWEDAKLFYYPLIEYALNHSEKVKVMYIKGNHSESMEWAFVQMLKERFKQVQFDDEFKERKVTMLGLNYIGATHGDKKKMQNLSENFAVEFPLEWSKAKTRTVYTGHLHHERVIDKGGLILRQLPSGIKADSWHEDMGYTTAHKRFLVHEFTYDKEKCIHYV
jgi:hypothetical protein